MDRHRILERTLLMWLTAIGTAAAQQVPAPIVTDTTPGRVSIVANGGLSAASGDSGGAMGLLVTASLTERLALEGLGTFTMSHGGMDNQALTASLLFNLAPRIEPVIPYLAAGIGVYRSSFDLDMMGFGRFFTQNPGYSGMMAFPGGGFGMMQGSHVVTAGPRFDGGNIPSFYAQRMGTLGTRSDGRFGVRSFLDPAFSLGGGVQLAVGRHFVVRPDARALVVLANGDRRTVGIVTLGLGYRF
jgi:hypothetical protein